MILETEAQTNASIAQYHEAIKAAKKTLILNAVEQTKGNYTEAAKLLGVNRNYLSRLIRDLNLKTAIKD